MLATIALAIALASDPATVMPADAVEALHGSRSAVLYSIEPWSRSLKGKPNYRGWQLLGKTRVDGEAYKIAAAQFELAAKSDDGMVAACFDPRHALKVASGGHQFEFLLCYACHRMEVYRDGKILAQLGVAGSAKDLNALLAAARVPVSASYDEDEVRARAIKSQEAYQRWREATPQSLSELTLEMSPFGGPEVVAPLTAALAQQYPDSRERILALYSWFGSGAGPWSGFPSYESAPEKLLLTYPMHELLAPLDAADLSEAQVEGAARLFGGWDFWSTRPNDLKQLPAALKARLLASALRSSDKDKQDRAKHAFGAK